MKTVLLVEDNEANLYLIKFILKQNGMNVIVAKEGYAGLKMALEKQPDLIIMDVQLPDINGLEVTQKIRQDPKGKELVIVALTSYAMTGDREKALEAGCNGYMEKPINPETFIPDLLQFL